MAARSDGQATLTGTGTLLRLALRRDRVRLPAWTLGIGLMMGYFASALTTVYQTPQDLQAVAPLLGGPMGALFGGPGYGMDEPRLEYLLAGLYGAYVLIGAGLMSLLTVVRHTRAEEYAGRSELLRASVVGRHAPLTAALVLTTVMNAVVVVVVGAIMAGQGYPVGGSWLFAVSVGAVGMSFAGVAAVTVQLTAFPRAAAGAAGAALGLAFALRALGDMTSDHGNVLSWLSPIGWAQQTAPYVLDRWWPLILSVAFAAATVAAGYVLSTRRDVAAGLVASRPGPSRAAPWLGSPLALAWRLQRTAVLGWAIALTIGAAAYGAFTGPALDAFDDAPEELLVVMGGTEDIASGFLAVLALTFGLAVAIFAVLAAQGVRTEETSGRAEPVLAAAVGRARWLGTHLLVSGLAVAGLLLVAGIAIGVSAAASVGDGALVGEMVLATMAYAPAVWLVQGVATILYGGLPRLVPLAWVLVGYGLVTGFFGPLLDLPEGVVEVSPFAQVGRAPLEAVSAGGVVLLTALAAVAVAGGLGLFRRRDVLATG